jgi:hypothetical protein
MKPNLPDLIGSVETGLAALPRGAAGDYEALRVYHRAADALLDSFEQIAGAKISRTGNNWTLRMAGCRASSTGGAASLLHNWKAGAERLLEALRVAGAAT